VELHAIQAGGANGESNFVEAMRTKDTNFFEAEWQSRRNRRDLSFRYLPLTRSEDKSGGISAAFGGQARVFEIGVAADLDPHGRRSLLRGHGGPGNLFLRGRRQQALEGMAWICPPHQSFADQEGMKARVP
jgi:hypothetical protein